MTNKELIEKLQQLPPEMEVIVLDWRKFHNAKYKGAKETGIHDCFSVSKSAKNVVISFDNEK